VSSAAAVKEPVKTLLLGMGNAILCDDAVGIRLAKYLGKRLAHAPGLSVLEECSVGGLNILDVVTGYDRLIILDSIKTGGAKPGDWYRFTGESLRETMHLDSVHDTNMATALELGRKLGLKLPEDRDIHIFAVEVQDNITFSERMTEVLERDFLQYAEEIYKEAAELVC
jgi:hydrogenase maturation protease